MTTDLFAETHSETKPTEQDILSSLVGEGKKFQTTEQLAKGKMESDQFIEQLKTEQAALRKQLEEAERKAQTGTTLKEIMDTLKEQKARAGQEGTDGNQSTLDPEGLQKLIDARLNDWDTGRTKQSNKQRANQMLLDKFEGDAEKARLHISTRAAELDITAKELGEMSENSPKAFARLMGIEPKLDSKPTGNSSATARATTNTEAFQVRSPEERDISYYQDMRKTNSKLFWSPSTQQEIIRLAEKNGGAEVVQKILNP